MKLHSETTGRGPDLVLLHGWGLHSGIWAPLLPALRQRHRVICIDLPGHGASPATPGGFELKQAAEAAAELAPPGAAWLGWSLGGQVAMAAALSGVDMERLVLVATTPRFVSAPAWPCAMAPATFAGFSAALAKDHRRTVRDFLTLQLRGDRHAATLLRTLRGVLAERPEPDPAALRAGLDILAATDLRDRLPAIGQRVLVVAGGRDRLTPAEAGRRLAAGLPQARCLVLPGAAHVPFLNHPEAFLDAVSAFLESEEIAA